MLSHLRPLLAFALALALVLGQVAADAHALGHASTEVRTDGAPDERECPDHALYTPLAATIAGSPGVWHFDAATFQPPRMPAPRRICLSPRHSFHSRAPPAA